MSDRSGRDPDPEEARKAIRDIVSGSGELRDLSPRRFRLVGTEVPSQGDDRRWFVIDDWRLRQGVLAFDADAIVDEEVVEGRGGSQLTAFSVRPGAPVLIGRQTTIERLMTPLLRENLQVAREALADRWRQILARQEGGGGGGVVFDIDDDDDRPDIELTFAAVKDLQQFESEPMTDPEFTIQLMKESIGGGGEAEGEEDEPEEGPSLPEGTQISPQEVTGKDQDELVYYTNILDDPLTLSIRDFTLKMNDRPDEVDEEDEDGEEDADRPPLPTFKSVLEDLPSLPDDLPPLPPPPPRPRPDRIRDLLKWFSIPKNPDPEPDPNERRFGLDIIIPF